MSAAQLTVHELVLSRPDGRRLTLYGRAPVVLDGDPDASAILAAPVAGGHLRWHPLREEWVIYAGHRQERSFLPADNPLAPPRPGGRATEVPAGRWDVAVFDNRFPALAPQSGAAPETLVETQPAKGRCEVVVFGQDPTRPLGKLPAWHVELILAVWAERTRVLAAEEGVQYVLPFENRGVEIGVTLTHPHGQIYAYPFVPPEIARQQAAQRAYLGKHGRPLLADLLEAELRDDRRVLWRGERAVAVIPACARWAYEIWVAPRRPAPTLDALDALERAELARALRRALLLLDGLWARPMPYVLAVYQAPPDGAPHPESHVHLQIWPALRQAGRQKFLAGSELAAGVFTADTLPEDKAAELRAVDVSAEEAAAEEAR